MILCKEFCRTAVKFVVLGGLFWASLAGANKPLLIPSPPQLAASSYLLIDVDSGEVLVEHNAAMPLPPASLTKMMTSYIIGKEIQSGNIKKTDKVKSSEKAWATGNPIFKGSSLMFLEVGTEVEVGLLNKGIIIASGNDACVAMAEHIKQDL